MGRGNYRPDSEWSFQWYVDYDNYRDKDEISGEDFLNEELLDYDIEEAIKKIEKRFRSFKPKKLYRNSYFGEVIRLKNKMYRIGVADNFWSLAIFIEMRDDLYPDQEALAKHHFDNYVDGIQEILIDVFGELQLRNGPWMSYPLKAEGA